MKPSNPQVYTLAEVKKKRKYIHSQLIEHGLSSSLKEWNATHLQRMYELYDEEFFDKEISEKLRITGSTVKFQTTSGNNAKIGGWCKTQKLTPQRKTCTFTISFPRGLYLKLFTDPSVKTLKSNGVVCYDRLECLQLTFEHEFVHLIMQLYGQYKNIKGKGKMIYTSHGKLFQCFVKAYFGHTDFRHALLAGESSTKLSPSRTKIGMSVKFEATKGGVMITGTVMKINKKTVRVRSVNGFDSFLVPYSHLMRVNDGGSSQKSGSPVKDISPIKGKLVTGRMTLISDYSAKSAALYGVKKEDRNLHNQILKAGNIRGRFNPNLAFGPGWIFSSKSVDELKRMLNNAGVSLQIMSRKEYERKKSL